MKKHLSILACLFTAVNLFAGVLKIVDVGPTINCLFNNSCTLTVEDTNTPITFTGATGTGYLYTRIYTAATNAPLAGHTGYVYRIDLTRVNAPTTNDYIDTLVVNFGPITPFTYNGVTSNMVWVATSGGVGSIGPSSATELGNTITFHFSPPIYASSGSFSGQTTFFFGVVSAYTPTTTLARVTGIQAPPPAPPLNESPAAWTPFY